MRSLWNSFYVSAMSVVWASVLALPLAYLTTRFAFRGAAISRVPAIHSQTWA